MHGFVTPKQRSGEVWRSRLKELISPGFDKGFVYIDPRLFFLHKLGSQILVLKIVPQKKLFILTNIIKI
jgi:hypothetical protein